MPSKYTKEYYEKNKEIIKQRNREYAKTHKEIVLKHDKYFDEVTNNKNNRLNKHWTIKEVDYLKEHYGIMKTKVLAKKLNRSIKSIQIKASDFNLKYSDNYYNYTRVTDLANLFIPFLYANRDSVKTHIHSRLSKYFDIKKINNIYYIDNDDVNIIKNFMKNHTSLHTISKELNKDSSFMIKRAKRLNILVRFIGLNFIKNSDIPLIKNIKSYNVVKMNEIQIIKNNIDKNCKELFEILPIKRNLKTIRYYKKAIKNNCL